MFLMFDGVLVCSRSSKVICSADEIWSGKQVGKKISESWENTHFAITTCDALCTKICACTFIEGQGVNG